MSDQELSRFALLAVAVLCAVALVVATGVVYLVLRTLWRWVRSGTARKDLWR